MAEQPAESTDPTFKVARAKPLTGAILGVIVGLAAAIVLQQQGVWPLDRVTTFLLPAIVGLLGVVLMSIGRAAATAMLVTSLVVLVPMAAWGATGLFSDESGQINGGCTASAQSSIDSTTVVDTSRSDPFRLDPAGSIAWQGNSPTVFQDFEWNVWVELGGARITIESGTAANANRLTQTSGSEPVVEDRIASYGLPADQMRGVFKVGAEAATCDGFGFVVLTAGLLETWIARIAAVIGLATLAILLITAFTGRARPIAAGDAGSVWEEGEEKSPF